MTRSPDLKLVHSQPAPARAPASRPIRGFAPRGGRGRSAGDARGASGFALRDPLAFRAAFPAIWQRFLIARWGDDAHAIAAHFDVRVQTARNWLGGLHRPVGDVVAHAMFTHRAEIAAAALALGVR